VGKIQNCSDKVNWFRNLRRVLIGKEVSRKIVQLFLLPDLLKVHPHLLYYFTKYPKAGLPAAGSVVRIDPVYKCVRAVHCGSAVAPPPGAYLTIPRSPAICLDDYFYPPPGRPAFPIRHARSYLLFVFHYVLVC
jgi:hypothetical protein